MNPVSRLRRGLVAALLLAPLVATQAWAQTPLMNEGSDYKLVHQPSPPPNPKHILVEEFFWYGCPHCFHADPIIAEWRAKKAADVDFTRLPLTLGRQGGEAQVRAYYVAQTLGIEEKTHRPMFDAIHLQGKAMATQEETRALFEQVADVKPAQFDALYTSFAIDGDYHMAENKAMQYGVMSVPTIVVGGKYSMNAGQPDTAARINFLVDKVRTERGLPMLAAATPMPAAAAPAPTSKKKKKTH